MATKLKSKKSLALWGLLLVFGLTNLITVGTVFRPYTSGLVMRSLILVLLVSGVAMLSSALFLNLKYNVHKIDGFRHLASFYNSLPVDVRFGTLTVSFLVALLYFLSVSSGYIGDLNLTTIVFKYIVTACMILFIVLQMQWLAVAVNDRGQFLKSWRESLSGQAGNILRAAFLRLPAGWKVSGIIAAIFFLGMSVPVLMLLSNGFFVPLIFLFVIGLPLLFSIFKRVAAFNRIYLDVAATASGSDQPDLSAQGRGMLDQLAEYLNTLKHGVKASRKEQVKSERLKTELITNVSHDLRTPLTSIITYSELLKAADLAEDEQKAYLHIIDRKAKRLKHLIDDLFEASKMASGAAELHKEKVDLVELMTQALAEYDETIQEAPLEFRVKKPDKPVFAFVDGQKIWRVFDNLISNIIKYSLEGTRVYISLGIEAGEAIAVFKNITKYELGADSDELFERFKRGDASRHTEGSGLGLAIAKSIADLHDGLFEIDLDGDLFKVTMKLPVMD